MDDLIDSMARRHLASRRREVMYSISNFIRDTSVLVFRELLIVNGIVMEILVHMPVGKDRLK